MKIKFFVLTSIGLTFVMALVIGWISLVRSLNPSVQVNWARGLYDRKTAAAQLIEGPRVLLIGGSGTHYGYSGAEITRLTGLPTVNFGVHAGLGMSYLLYRAMKELRPGDFAVIIIETPLNFSFKPSKVLSEFVIRYDMKYLLHSSLIDGLSLLFGYSPLDVIDGLVRSQIPWTAETGRPESVDANGDETLDVSRVQTPGDRNNLMNAGPMPTWPADSNHPPIPLQKFFKWAQYNNVKFGISWTPMLARREYNSSAYQKFNSKIVDWYELNGGVALGSPEQYYLTAENMFDYIIHANEKGKIYASRILAHNLCKVLACQSPEFTP